MDGSAKVVGVVKQALTPVEPVPTRENAAHQPSLTLANESVSEPSLSSRRNLPM